MKYLRTFENFQDDDLGRFSGETIEPECKPCTDEEEWDEEGFEDEGSEGHEEEEGQYSWESDEEEGREEEEENRIRRWGDEVVEKKKVNAGLQAYLDKKKGKKSTSEKKDDSGKKSKSEMPDFPDVDKDGDKKESIKKAAKDAKESKKEEKGGKGLTAAQKKLPEGLRKAIEAKKK